MDTPKRKYDSPHPKDYRSERKITEWVGDKGAKISVVQTSDYEEVTAEGTSLRQFTFLDVIKAFLAGAERQSSLEDYMESKYKLRKHED